MFVSVKNKIYSMKKNVRQLKKNPHLSVNNFQNQVIVWGSSNKFQNVYKVTMNNMKKISFYNKINQCVLINAII